MSTVTISQKVVSEPNALRLGLALCAGTMRFNDLHTIVRHPQMLMRVLRKMIAAKLVEKSNLGEYRITARGCAWAMAGAELIQWIDEHDSDRQRPIKVLMVDRVSNVVTAM